MSAFNGSTLLISARSPFARRVRVAFYEHGIQFEELQFNVLEDNPALNKLNPLGRVPVVKLINGQSVMDSTFILSAFYDEQTKSQWMPFSGDQKRECLNWSALAVGICEKFVETFLESMRPAAYRDPQLLAESRRIWNASMTFAEERLGKSQYLVGDTPYQCDIDWKCTIDYLQLRFPVNLKETFPNLHRYSELFSARESFRKTAPPPA